MERWTDIRNLFHEAYELAPEEQARVLGRADVDPEVREQVERLLAADGRGAGIMDRAAPLVAVEAPATFVGEDIGPYRVTREIGRGGMGTVYEAVRRDGDFEQRVAIKRLRVGLDLPELVAQFRRERQILATLQHPNIAALYDGGVTRDGVPYIVLEYVDGIPIDRYCDEQRLDLKDRLDLFRDVLGAVQYAHSQLVIHRDLKPGNILVTREGHVKLLDFGVARLMHADGREVTLPGAAGITPAYASPEQLRGERASTATDVYSLGVVLFRLLAGKGPVSADLLSPVAVLAALTSHPLPAPSTDPTPEAARHMGLRTVSRLRRLLAGELDAVVLKAMRAEPERRYLTVDAMADDIRCYLRGLPVSARADTAWYRLARFVTRRRALVGALATAAMALVVGTTVALREAQRADSKARRATRVATFLQEVIGASAPLGTFRAPGLGPMATLAELTDTAAARIDTVAGDDPEVRTILHHFLGQAYRSQERPAAAAREFVAVDRLALPTFGPGLAEATASAALGELAREQGAWRLADSLLGSARRTLARIDRRRPDRYGALLAEFGYLPRQPWPALLAGMEAEVEGALAAVRVARGDLPGATNDLRATLSRAAAAHAPDDVRAALMSQLGVYLLSTAASRTEGAMLLRQAQRMIDAMPRPDLTARMIVLSSLVTTATATGREADSLGRELLRLSELATGPSSLSTARLLWLRGSTARMAGDTAGQRTMLTRALRIVEQHPAVPTDLRHAVRMEYARTQWLAGHLDSAVTIADGVYRERMTAGGFPLAESGLLLGSLHQVRGQRTPVTRGADYARAEALLLESDSIMRSLLPPTHYWPMTTASTLVRLYRGWGQHEKLAGALRLLPDSARRVLEKP
ncbi:MAG: serine/threonine protein kinase [Gemmatimonadetes bacterium]|nr:serine/threonine protein kinase [Gemmatimonadota bacterium]